MHWIQISTEINRSHAEQLETAMSDLGALAVTYGDAADQPLFEPEPGTTPLWESILVIGLFEADAPTASITRQLEISCGISTGNLKVEILEDKDWSREWMEHFKPVQFGQRLWICPTWLEPPEPAAANLMLDPGMAFGTGTHPTTQLCLKWLERQPLDGASLIDYGCGSGILAIAGLLLGCKQAWATDIDPLAISATLQNAERNNINPEILNAALTDEAQLPSADIVIANILAGPLVELAPVLAPLCRESGHIVLSGLLHQQTQEVKQAYAPWFEFTAAIEHDGWMMLEGRRSSMR